MICFGLCLFILSTAVEPTIMEADVSEGREVGGGTKSTNETFPTLGIQSSKSLKFRLDNTNCNTPIRHQSILSIRVSIRVGVNTPCNTH